MTVTVELPGKLSNEEKEIVRNGRPSARRNNQKSVEFAKPVDSSPQSRKKMRLDKLTEKSREALLEAQHLAGAIHHPAVEPEHLLAALLQQENGVVPSIINKIGGDTQLLMQSVDAALNKLPRATGSSVQVGMSRELTNILNEAESIADAMKDDYTSTEHLLMAMAPARAAASASCWPATASTTMP